MIINWHDYYKFGADDWFNWFLSEWNEAAEHGHLDVLEDIEKAGYAKGVWVDDSGCFRHKDDPHKLHTIDEILADEWIEY